MVSDLGVGEARRIRLERAQKIVELERGWVTLPASEYMATEQADAVLLRPVSGADSPAAVLKVSKRAFVGWLNQRELVYLSW